MDLNEIILQKAIANLKVKNEREAALQEIFEYCIENLRAGKKLVPAAANYLADALQSVLDTPQTEIPIDATAEIREKIREKNLNRKKNAIAKTLKIAAGNKLREVNTFEIGTYIDFTVSMKRNTIEETIANLADEYNCHERTIRQSYDKYRQKYHKYRKSVYSKSPSE